MGQKEFREAIDEFTKATEHLDPIMKKTLATALLSGTEYCVVKREEAAMAVWCAGYIDGLAMRTDVTEEVKRALRSVVEKLADFTLPTH